MLDLLILKGTWMNLKNSRLMSLATSILVIGSSFVGLGATAANAASSPINVTFESNDTSGYSFVDYDGNVTSTTTSQPAGAGFTSGTAMKMDNDGAPWAGTTFLTIDSTSSLLSAANKTASINIYAPDALDRCVDLKLEGTAVAEKTLHISGAGWQTLTFDYSSVFDPSAKYVKASLMPNIASVGCGDWGTWPKGLTTWYVDNISFPGAVNADVVIPRTTPSVLVNFESNDTSGYALTNFGGVDASLDTGAPDGGSVGSTTALRIKDQGDCWSGTTFLTRGAKESLVSSAHPVVTANIYAPVAGKDLKLKLENALTGAFKEADVTSVVGWKTYSFDFTGFDASVDYNKASVFMNFTCASGSKGSQGYGIDDIAFNGATGAALGAVTPPTVFTGHATVRLAGIDSTNSVERTADETTWCVTNDWYRCGVRAITKQVPVASTQHLTFVVNDSADGKALANTSVTLVLGKAWSGSTAHSKVGTTATAGGDCWCGNDQATVTGVTGSDGTVTFDLVNTDNAADAADNPGSALNQLPTGKDLRLQIAAWVTSQTQDSIDVVDLVYYKPADVAPTPTIVTRVTGIDSSNAYVGSCEGWCQYYADGLRYFERGVTVGTTTTLSYTVTANGAPYANKTVHLLLGKTYSGSSAKVSVNGHSFSGGGETVVDLVTNSQGVVTFDVVNTNFNADADPYQESNLAHPVNGKHLFAQLALVGEKGNGDVLDILDLVYYQPKGAEPATTYNVRLADWSAANSFDGTHIWGDGGLGSWFDATTRYFAHYVAAGSTFNVRYKVTNAATGANAPNGTVVTLYLGSAWSGSNAKFTVNGVDVDGRTKWGANGQLDQATTTATVSNGYITVPMTATDVVEDATINPGNPTANPDALNPLFMQIKLHVEGNAITQQDWVNIVVTGPAAAPSITSISGTAGKKGQAIDIVGTNLGDALGSTVTLYTAATKTAQAISTPVTVLAVSADGTRLTVASPNSAQKGYFKVTNTGGTATASKVFSSMTTVTAKPAITLSASLVKEVGASFTLTGTNLGSSTNIAIGGVSAPFTVINANSVSVTVPAGVTSGSTISATNAGGTYTTTKFVFQAAVITDITTSGKVGATVTVTGKNLKEPRSYLQVTRLQRF